MNLSNNKMNKICTSGTWELCNNDKCGYCFNRSFASHPKSMYWSKKNSLQSRRAFKSSQKKFIFDCNICKHEFSDTLGHITNSDRWCPYCACKLLCVDGNCKYCYNKSFASHPRCEYWSNKNKCMPKDVFKSTHNKYLFNCDVCKHEFLLSIAHVTNENKWCPYCGNRKICTIETCEYCYNKSFASHPRSVHWSDKNKVNPRDVSKNNNKKYLFECNICKHEFCDTLNHITASDRWCPYCASRILCDIDDCRYCFNRSFASHPKVTQWSDKNKVKPRDVFKGSQTKYLFNCTKCFKEFEKPLHVISRSDCPLCFNKTELKLLNSLTDLGYTVKTQFKFNECVNSETNRKLPFDFLIDEYKIIVELDGGQHFKQVMNWKSPEEQQRTDKYKMKRANENGYTVIRILQNDVWNDKNNWLKKLESHIYLHERPQKIYIASDNSYEVYSC